MGTGAAAFEHPVPGFSMVRIGVDLGGSGDHFSVSDSIPSHSGGGGCAANSAILER